jgi:hypothetical protein
MGFRGRVPGSGFWVQSSISQAYEEPDQSEFVVRPSGGSLYSNWVSRVEYKLPSGRPNYKLIGSESTSVRMRGEEFRVLGSEFRVQGSISQAYEEPDQIGVRSSAWKAELQTDRV